MNQTTRVKITFQVKEKSSAAPTSKAKRTRSKPTSKALALSAADGKGKGKAKAAEPEVAEETIECFDDEDYETFDLEQVDDDEIQEVFAAAPVKEWPPKRTASARAAQSIRTNTVTAQSASVSTSGTSTPTAMGASTLGGDDPASIIIRDLLAWRSKVFIWLKASISTHFLSQTSAKSGIPEEEVLTEEIIQYTALMTPDGAPERSYHDHTPN
jgi:hypothetical protein